MYFTRSQIQDLVERIGQPQVSVLLNSFFNTYRHFLKSSDVAQIYDQGYFDRISSHPVAERVAGSFDINIYNRYSYDYIVPRLGAESRVLDVGCGSGDFALALATHEPKEVVGIDWSADAISSAVAKLAGTPLHCQFIQGEFAEIAGAGKFDFVVLNDVSEHLSDGELASLLDLLRGVLKATGQLIIHTPNGLALCNGTDENWLSRAYKLYLKLRSGWQGFERDIDQIYYDQVHINIKSYRQLKTLLSREGFSSSVFYDEQRRWTFLDALSSNMTVIAEPIECKGISNCENQ